MGELLLPTPSSPASPFRKGGLRGFFFKQFAPCREGGRVGKDILLEGRWAKIYDTILLPSLDKTRLKMYYSTQIFIYLSPRLCYNLGVSTNIHNIRWKRYILGQRQKK
jgi:hypothetical protein